MPGLTRVPNSAIPVPRTTRYRFAFCGVAFEVLADRGVDWMLLDSCLSHLGDTQRDRMVAEVVCSVGADRTLGEASDVAETTAREASFRRRDGRTQIGSAQLRAELCEIGRGKFAASARIAPHAGAATALVLALAAATLDQLGGVSLNATAIELNGKAVLLLGPSGADKTTAVELATGALLFARNQVRVAIGADGQTWAFSLPGGDAIAGTACSPRRSLPLAALVRVRQGQPQDETSLQRLDDVTSLSVLRDSVAQINDGAGAAHERRAKALSRLLRRVPVFELHSVLGKSNAHLLQAAAALPVEFGGQSVAPSV